MGDVERTDDGVSLKDWVSRDRMMSVHDPEMRHGHKSSSRRFDGHKAAIVVDTGSQLITAVAVLPGNARTTWERWNWWSRARPTPVCRWRKPWAMPLMATAISQEGQRIPANTVQRNDHAPEPPGLQTALGNSPRQL